LLVTYLLLAYRCCVQKQQRIMAMMSMYCHDWRKPEFTTAGICPNFRRRARTAPPRPTGRCGCPELKVAKKPTTDPASLDRLSLTVIPPDD